MKFLFLLFFLFVTCFSFRLTPPHKNGGGFSVLWTPIDSLTCKQEEKYENAVIAWKSHKSSKNLSNMRLQKEKLKSIKRSSKSGLLSIICHKRRFTEYKTVSVRVIGKTEEWLGIHSFIGLSDTIRLNLDCNPRTVIIVDQVTKEEYKIKLHGYK